MELHQLTAEEIRGFDAAKLKETESEIRSALVTIRMDIYTAKNQHTSKIRGLKKSLARLLTHKTTIKAPAKAKAAKVAAPKAEAKPKAAKAAAPAKAPKAEKAAKAPKAEAKAKTSTKKK